jgi:hypothetical protein
MDIERLDTGIACVPDRGSGSPHEAPKALGPETMRTMRVKYVSQEKAVPDFLPVHSN